jgi:serine/threonine-protein kinase
MGVVVAATDNLLGREVALKFLLPHPAAAEQTTGRLMREAQSIARIKTEHVVQLMDVGVFRGAPFLVMEHLAGEDLRRLVGRRGPLRLTVAVDYVMQALQAIAEAHMKGIVHRDLKASNLFVLQRPDGTPLIKVIDFGIAKSLGDEALAGVTQTGGGLLGSPSHLSPEQLKSPRDVDARTDIWALGVTLFELLTNALPFPDDSCASLLAAISNEVPRTFRDLGCDVPPAFQDIVSDCLNKDRTRRVPSAFELAKRLAPFGSADARLSLSRIEGIVQREAPAATEPDLVPASPQFADTEPARDAGTGNSWGNTTSEQRSSLLTRRIRSSGVLAAVGVASFAGVHYWLSARGSPQTPPRTVSARIVPSSEPSARPPHVGVNANRTDRQQTPDLMPSGVETSAPSVRVVVGTFAAKRAATPPPLPSASTSLTNPVSSVSANVAGRRSIEDLIEERR